VAGVDWLGVPNPPSTQVRSAPARTPAEKAARLLWGWPGKPSTMSRAMRWRSARRCAVTRVSSCAGNITGREVGGRAQGRCRAGYPMILPRPAAVPWPRHSDAYESLSA